MEGTCRLFTIFLIEVCVCGEDERFPWSRTGEQVSICMLKILFISSHVIVQHATHQLEIFLENALHYKESFKT
jgi:hypothetical protein